MEWIGFYGEMIAANALRDYCQIPGDKYGRVSFDAFRDINWDLKVHPNTQNQAILNDAEAMDLSYGEYGHHGLIILCVDCAYDEDGAFKAWHDQLKGGTSRYEQQRVARNAPSRKRKIAASLTEVALVVLDKERCRQLSKFQEGMRNSNGTPRRPKYAISHAQIAQFKLGLL